PTTPKPAPSSTNGRSSLERFAATTGQPVGQGQEARRVLRSRPQGLQARSAAFRFAYVLRPLHEASSVPDRRLLPRATYAAQPVDSGWHQPEAPKRTRGVGSRERLPPSKHHQL